jgi:hypothetical protein
MTTAEFGEHVGEAVVYTPAGARRTTRREQGVITSVGAFWVFVRYGADIHSKATDPAHLTLLAEAARS